MKANHSDENEGKCSSSSIKSARLSARKTKMLKRRTIFFTSFSFYLIKCFRIEEGKHFGSSLSSLKIFGFDPSIEPKETIGRDQYVNANTNEDDRNQILRIFLHEFEDWTIADQIVGKNQPNEE